MKNLLALSIVLFSGVLFAQMYTPSYPTAYPEVRLFPGQSQVFYDYNSQQPVQVVCLGSQPMPPPPQPMPGQECSIKYNTGMCGAYQVYKGGQAAAACTGSMDAAISQMKNLIAGRMCSEPRPVGCDVKYNTGMCGGYQVYAYMDVISPCFAGLDQAQSVVNTLRVNNICM